MTALGQLPRFQTGELRLTPAPMTDIQISPDHPDSADARWCLGAYADEMHKRFGFSPVTRCTARSQRSGASGGPAAARASRHRTGRVLRAEGPTVPISARSSGLWISRDVRGHGLGRRLLAGVEIYARARGLTRLRLDTHSSLAEALALYRSRGYGEVERFNTDPYAEHWFEKRLAPLG
ncbi:MAG: GNAT family N-acetyltransferase [Hyphomicrobium sp.]